MKYRCISGSVTVTGPVFVDPGVAVGSGARLGPNVYLETGTVVGAGATISDSVLLGCRVSPDAAVSSQILSEDR